jgi:nucleotide-binding universal stress UspA family protein
MRMTGWRLACVPPTCTFGSVLSRDDTPAERTSRETDLFRALDDRRVLFAYDGSEQAKASILEAAHRLGPDRCAIVLTVWQAVRTPPFAGAPSHAPPDFGCEEKATRLAYEGARLARSIGFDAQPVVASGDAVWREIVNSADAHDASIVVLGCGPNAGAGLMSAGGVAAAVARHTTRSVLILAAATAEGAASTVLAVHSPSAVRAA